MEGEDHRVAECQCSDLDVCHPNSITTCYGDCGGHDEPQGSGRAEVEVQNLKAQVRLLLRASSSPDEVLWPLALRHAAEARCRMQLLSMGPDYYHSA